MFVARAVPSGGQVFGGWSGTSAAVGCRLCEATSYTMPDGPASITAAFTSGPVLDVQPLLVDLGAGGVARTFRIRDLHPEGGPLTWSVSEREPWLEVDCGGPCTGRSGEAEVRFTVDRSEQRPGTFTGRISVNSNGGLLFVVVQIVVE